MRKLLSLLGLATVTAVLAGDQSKLQLKDGVKSPSLKGYGSTGFNAAYNTNPIYFPKKHTVCSYRHQQRQAKKNRKRK